MKPVLIMDQHFRKAGELFAPETLDALHERVDIRGGNDSPMPRDEIARLLPEAAFYVAARPEMTADEITRAKNLRAVIEVAGAFGEGLDYDACFTRGVECLSCSPGFRQSVAEMALAMMLAGARGLVAEHEAFRSGTEAWLADCEDRDFTLHGANIGFIGYGQIARETQSLLRPFNAKVHAYDPYIKAAKGGDGDTVFCDLETLVKTCRVIVVAAVPSEETRGLLSAGLIKKLMPGALVVVISRAWCVDFPALTDAARDGKITLATDVFPEEPLTADDPLRTQPRNLILSPHRAAAVDGGRRLIGEMILHDVGAILDGRTERQLKPATPEQMAGLVAAQRGMPSIPNT